MKNEGEASTGGAIAPRAGAGTGTGTGTGAGVGAEVEVEVEVDVGVEAGTGPGTGVGKRGDRLAAALEHLPHGPEFRFVDRLLELTGGVSGVGEYTVRGDEAFLRGHFPDEPLMPGVLLVEAGAQLAGVVLQSDPDALPLRGLKLAAIRQARIKGSARPGQTLRIEATILARLVGLVQARVRVLAGSQVLLEAEVALGGMQNANL